MSTGSGSASSLSTAEVSARQDLEGRTYWQIVKSQLRKNPAGVWGLRIIAFIVFIAVFAPLLANDKPIIATYKGSVHFPAFTGYVDSWVPWQGLRFEMRSWRLFGGLPFSDRYEALGGKTWKEVIAEDSPELGFAIMPPVPWHPTRISDKEIKASPSSVSRHYLGTDDQGRDVAARIIHGAVVAVTVGLIAETIAVLIGVVLGTIAGYRGGKVDLVLGRIVEIVMCFPTFFLIITVISFLPPSNVNIMVVIGFVSWTGIYRLVRGEVLKNKQLDYVTAARALGYSENRIMFRQILPNSVAPVFVSAAFGIAGAVLTESGLSFLGFGDTTVASWGEVVSQGRNYVQEGCTHLVIWPGVAIFVTLTAFNLFGQGLRDAMDPRLRK